MVKDYFGKTKNGESAEIYTLTNKTGMCVKITNYGGIVVSILVNDRFGNLKDVVLGYDSVEKYCCNGPYFGAIVGRFCNRIAEGKFSIGNKQYQLAINNGSNHLHGGNIGFSRVLWNANVIDNSIELTYMSADGEENYPGNLKVKVIYTLSDENELKLDYYAVADSATPINLTNHSYFNLNGHNSGNILNHQLWINADSYTETDNKSIPTGNILNVKGTPMDFLQPTEIGKRIDDDYEQLQFANGYDHNWSLNKIDDGLQKASSLYCKESGILLEVYTTLPGMQIYTGNYLDDYSDILGKENTVYHSRYGICFESQYFPNCVNIPQFESCIFDANKEYRHTTVFKFGIEK